MSSIVTGAGNLVASVAEIIKGILSTIFSAVAGIFNLAADAIMSVVMLAVRLLQNIFNLAEGTLMVIVGNIFFIMFMLIVWFGYEAYHNRSGRTTITKKRN